MARLPAYLNCLQITKPIALYLEEWEFHRSLFFDLGDPTVLDYTHIINKFNQPTRTMSSS
jgi:hypothetical protein